MKLITCLTPKRQAYDRGISLPIDALWITVISISYGVLSVNL
jgi:hypothetical protein